MKKISEKIRAAVLQRIDKGETPYAIAKAANVSQSTLSRWLRGGKSLTVESQDAIAEWLGWTVGPIKPTASRKGKR
jgi:transcriptional regulator with XRE-family HTH domain